MTTRSTPSLVLTTFRPTAARRVCSPEAGSVLASHITGAGIVAVFCDFLSVKTTLPSACSSTFRPLVLSGSVYEKPASGLALTSTNCSKPVRVASAPVPSVTRSVAGADCEAFREAAFVPVFPERRRPRGCDFEATEPSVAAARSTSTSRHWSVAGSLNRIGPAATSVVSEPSLFTQVVAVSERSDSASTRCPYKRAATRADGTSAADCAVFLPCWAGPAVTGAATAASAP